MDSESYSIQARRFRNPQLNPEDMLTNAALGCAGEAGEFADHIKKVRYQGHALDLDHTIKELGDQLWYINLAIAAFQEMGFYVTLGDVMHANLKKLEERYPNGFTPQASRDRATAHVEERLHGPR